MYVVGHEFVEHVVYVVEHEVDAVEHAGYVVVELAVYC